jgi:acetyltransferase-like isoleucine patch superfamily enzyme
LVYPGVQAGRRSRVGRGCRLILDSDARLILGDQCTVDDHTTLAAYHSGIIRLGPGSFVGHYCTIAARESVEIGAGTYLAELVSVRDHDHAVGASPGSGAVEITPVSIGDDVWLAAKVTVLRGSRIGDRSVIGANAVVRGEIPARSVAVGIPASVVRTIESE